jgi:uncharacterized C2H2 Zn-finger protein
MENSFYKCGFCGKILKSQSSLNKHIKTSLGAAGRGGGGGLRWGSLGWG